MKVINKIASLGLKILKISFGSHNKEYISREDIARLFTDINPSCRFQFFDCNYLKTNTKTVQNLLDLNVFNNRKYTRELFDCDDFSLNMMTFSRYVCPGISVGMVLVTMPDGVDGTKTFNHALNFFIDENQEIVYIEPQIKHIMTQREPDYEPYMVIL